ncbi:MAG: sel1 repeat family protein [Blastochloris sp.]|nr:sel1 repeat family protein [Blastochloris sp.]
MANPSKAAIWYEKAANQGHEGAQNDLGLLYYQGRGVKVDGTKAVFWLEKAAAQNNLNAMVNLGVIYDEGKVLPGDPVLAMKWFVLAGKRGDEPSKADAQRLQQSMKPEQVQQALKLVQEFGVTPPS